MLGQRFGHCQYGTSCPESVDRLTSRHTAVAAARRSVGQSVGRGFPRAQRVGAARWRFSSADAGAGLVLPHWLRLRESITASIKASPFAPPTVPSSLPAMIAAVIPASCAETAKEVLSIVATKAHPAPQNARPARKATRFYGKDAVRTTIATAPTTVPTMRNQPLRKEAPSCGWQTRAAVVPAQ
jgi:hypothetical protein